MASREGSINAKTDPNNSHFKIFAMYPRRPKISKPGCNLVQMKVNQVLFDHSSFLDKLGIPTIIGIPLANSILGLSYDTTCRWFTLTKEGIETHQPIDLLQPNTIPVKGLRIIDEHGIIEFSQFAQTFSSWTEIISLLRTGPGHSRWLGYFGYAYKPVYFILHV